MKIKTANGHRYTVRTKFGLWLVDHMAARGLTFAEVGEKVHLTRQHVNSHAAGLVKPTFQNVVVYCWLFGMNDDPESIWKTVEEGLD